MTAENQVIHPRVLGKIIEALHVSQLEKQIVPVQKVSEF